MPALPGQQGPDPWLLLTWHLMCVRDDGEGAHPGTQIQLQADRQQAQDQAQRGESRPADKRPVLTWHNWEKGNQSSAIHNPKRNKM